MILPYLTLSCMGEIPMSMDKKNSIQKGTVPTADIKVYYRDHSEPSFHKFETSNVSNQELYVTCTSS